MEIDIILNLHAEWEIVVLEILSRIMRFLLGILMRGTNFIYKSNEDLYIYIYIL